MKMNLVHFLQCSSRISTGALGAMCIAALLPAMADDAVPEPAKESLAAAVKLEDAAIADVVNMRNDDVVSIEEKIAEAERLGRAQKYEDAIRQLLAVEPVLKKITGSKYAAEAQEVIISIRAKYAIKLAEQYLADASKKYYDAYALGAVEESNVLCTEAITEAENAKVVYYLGVLPGTGYDPHTLNHMVLNNPGFSAKVQQFINKCKKIQEAYKFDSETNLDAIDPNYVNRQDKIASLYDKAARLYKAKQYMEARKAIEDILVRDPYNAKAIQLLDKIYLKLKFIGETRLDVDFLRQEAEIVWSWPAAIPVNQPDMGEMTEVRERRVSVGSPLLHKLNAIMIEKIELEKKDILSAINKVKELSIEKSDDGKGINITLSVSNVDSIPPVDLVLQNVTLKEVLKYLCLKSGLEYRVHDDMIVIGNKSIDQYETKFIPVRQSVINRIMNETTSMRTQGRGGEELAIGAMDASVPEAKAKVTSEQLREYFTQLGITFTDEATVAYDNRTGKLTVKNTPDNIADIEQLILAFDVDNPLVLIVAKVIEIKMNDLEELGFDWVLTHSANDSDNWDIAISSPLRPSPFSNNKLINNMNILPNFGGDNSWNLYLTVNAIDRTDRAEILSAPKVMTMSGHEATIQMVREMYFPESWTEPEVENTNGTSISYTPSYPEFGDATPIGISFTVTPQVMSNKRTIMLDLFPKISDLTGWSDYSYDLIIGDYFKTDAANKVTLKMPEISQREVQTKVKVYNGQTIVVGGMLTDKHATLDDKWPVLGDVPLIGRLFTYSYEATERVNLLISVTPRLFTSSGQPLPDPDSGLRTKNDGKIDFGR